MQKLMFVLILGLLVGIAVASDGTIWIGNNKPEAIPCPNPTPVMTELPSGDFNPDADTIYYDDRMSYSGWIYYREGNGWGYKFTPPTNSGTITSALVYLYGATWPVPGGNRLAVRVLDADGPNGEPGTVLFEDTITGTRGQWNSIPMSVSFTNPNFYLFYIQVDSNPICPALSIDRFDNAPDGVKWQYTSGTYAPDPDRFGEWLIRAMIDWTPQTNNFGTLFFGNLPQETLPNINLQMRGTVKNFGSQTAASGVPVKLMITGPQGYVYTDYDQATTVSLQRGQTQMITFTPNWHVPDTMGIYTIKIWHELSGEEYPANDTITRTINIGRWITYPNWQHYTHLTWAGPERATKFHPANFNVSYPFQVAQAKAMFYQHQNYPWDDNVFYFKIYGNDGTSLLYESDTVSVTAPMNGTGTAQRDITPPVTITSGDFYLVVAPRSYSGHPSTLAESVAISHSYFGGPGAWTPASSHLEYFFAAAVRHVDGIAENSNPSILQPKLTVANYPNPTSDMVRVEWQIPQRGNLQISLFDVTGREVKTIYNNAADTRGVTYLNTYDLSNGAYMIRLINGKETATAKLILQK